MKNIRQSKILEFISKMNIETQEELVALLQKNGFNVTQATVSRDIKELRLIKVQYESGRSKYAASSQLTHFTPQPKFNKILSDSVIKTDFAGNIAVIKCHTGMAMAAATAIDAMNSSEIVGAVAGDDTVIVVLRGEKDAADFAGGINKLL